MFIIIKWPGAKYASFDLEKLLSTSTKALNTSSGSQRTSPGTILNIFQENVLKCIDTKWPKLAQSAPKSKLLDMDFLFYVISEVFKRWNKIKITEYIVKNKVLSKWLFSSYHTPKNHKYYHPVNSYMAEDDFSICF